MFWKTALSLVGLIALVGCGGFHPPLLIEVQPRACTALELDPVQRIPASREVWISFCLPDSGQTSLRILNQERQVIATVMDSMLCRDVYQFSWKIPDSVANACYVHLTWRNELRKKKFIAR